MKKAKSICSHPQCNVLINNPGYCEKHKKNSPFSGLKKTSETIQFYRLNKWRKTSELYRYENPLCYDCKMKGKIVPAMVVHHTPDLAHLLKNNLNPYDWKYLRGICFNCHQKELRKKRGDYYGGHKKRM